MIPTRTPKEILKFARLYTRDSTLYLAGSDGDVWIERKVAGDIDLFSALVPPTQLASILRECKSDEVEIVAPTKRSHLSVTAGTASYKLTAPDAHAWPTAESPNVYETCYVPSATLHEAIARAIPVCDVQSAKYALGSVNITTHPDGTLDVCSTDGRRMVLTTERVQVIGILNEPCEALVPQSAAKTVLALCDLPGMVTVSVGKGAARFTHDDCTVTCKLAEGRFPQYRNVIPSTLTEDIACETEIVKRLAKQSRICTDKESRSVRFTFQPGKILADTAASEIGSCKITAEAAYEGDEKSSLYDPTYVLDACNGIGDECILSMAENDSRLVITTPNVTHVIANLSVE